MTAKTKIPVKFQHSSLIPKGNNILPVAFLILCGFSGLSFLMVVGLMAQVNAIANRNNNTFVQLADGKTYYISERDENFRYPAVLKKSIEIWLKESFEWRNTQTQPGEQDTRSVGDRKFVSNRAYFASFLLESRLRPPILEEIANITPREAFNGGVLSAVIISDISEPKEIGVGRWEINVIATRVVITKDRGQEKLFPFNRTFKIKSVPIPRIVPPSNASDFEKKIYEYRSGGAEIFDIIPFVPK
ncbi:hypothetical protein [Merismopedia glauca]|uniref:Bacterial virulence protein VirB8 domain-containing protein n=1 Tax=Merismopedia glauca CCAP 1448/3 TaxID=1296344 RepID=A0A2T1C3P5_9CYAN|nr:hypothetical protein [Merismopedia glauca]PSB02767.1 hypothetical protein C7B64_11485 [Merismopedia glauca CCAP 1448/3]